MAPRDGTKEPRVYLPRCRYKASCTQPNCSFYHPPGEKKAPAVIPTVEELEAKLLSDNPTKPTNTTTTATAAAATRSKTKPKKKKTKVCRFGANCKKQTTTCQFLHPNHEKTTAATDTTEGISIPSTVSTTNTNQTTTPLPASNIFPPPAVAVDHPPLAEEMVLNILNDDDDQGEKARIQELLQHEQEQHTRTLERLHQEEAAERKRHDAEVQRLEALLQKFKITASSPNTVVLQQQQQGMADSTNPQGTTAFEPDCETSATATTATTAETSANVQAQKDELERLAQEQADAQLAREMYEAEQDVLRKQQEQIQQQQEKEAAERDQKIQEQRQRKKEAKRQKKQEKWLQQQQEQAKADQQPSTAQQQPVVSKTSKKNKSTTRSDNDDAEDERRALQERQALEEEERLKKQRWANEVKREKEVAAQKKRKKQAEKAQMVQQHKEELHQQVQKRTVFWNEQIKLEEKATHQIVRLCAAELHRHQQQQNPDGTQLSRKALADAAPEEFRTVCTEAFYKMFAEDLQTRVVVTGHKSETDGRRGEIQLWDKTKGKFRVVLETKKSKRGELIFLKPGQLEPDLAFDVQKKNNSNKKKKTFASYNIQDVSLKHLFSTLPIDQHKNADSSFCEVEKSTIETMLSLQERGDDYLERFLKDLMSKRNLQEKVQRKEEERAARLEAEDRKRRADRRRREQQEYQERQKQYKEEKAKYQQWQKEEARRQKRSYQASYSEPSYSEQRYNEEYYSRGRYGHDGIGCTCPECLFRHVFESHFRGGFGGGFFPFMFDDADDDDWDRRWEEQNEEEDQYRLEESAELLGVDIDADEQVIKRAYRRLALKFHPDKWHADKHEDGTTKEEAEERFKEITSAYDCLLSRFDDEDDYYY